MITLKNPQTNETKTVDEGFSVWYLFLGPILPLVKGMFQYFALATAKEICTLSLARFYIAFVFNKHLTMRHISEGYVPATAEDAQKVIKLNIGYTPAPLHEKLQKAA